MNLKLYRHVNSQKTQTEPNQNTTETMGISVKTLQWLSIGAFPNLIGFQ